MTNDLEVNIQELNTSNRSWYNHQFDMEMDGATLIKEKKVVFQGVTETLSGINFLEGRPRSGKTFSSTLQVI
jgi:hypothetical protein